MDKAQAFNSFWNSFTWKAYEQTTVPEKVACEYQGWKGVGDVEKYQNGEWSDSNGT